jgi:peptide chain release factor subunit 3
VTIKALICLVDKKTGEKSKTRPRFIKQDQIAIARWVQYRGRGEGQFSLIFLFRFVANHPICMETFKAHPQLGRFTLRDEGLRPGLAKPQDSPPCVPGTTIAIGKILKVVE